jgi:two-component system NtrC family sensor kinase
MQLLHAAKLASVGQLADGIAHEINNPAGIILTRSEYLASVIKEREALSSIHEDIEAIRRQARRIAEIVGSLLTFSRPSKLQVRRLDLNTLLTECLALLSPKFYGQKVEMHCDLDKSLPQVSGDADRLEQVFINILNNAIEAMPQGGRLAVRTGVNAGRNVYVQVSDTGLGITEEDLKKVFDPFFTTKQPGRGTGLGLSVSYGIIRDHGGRIEVSSVPGRGTTFKVILPLEVPNGRL